MDIPVPSRPTPPTSSLPPLARLAEHSTRRIRNALINLRNLYWPPPLPTRLSVPKRTIKTLIHDNSVPDSGYASAEEDEDDESMDEEVIGSASDADPSEDDHLDPDILRFDPFERAFTIKWITGFVARSDIWCSSSEDESDARAEILEEATEILCRLSGDEDETEVTRSFSFRGMDGSTDIKVELNDAPLLNEDHTSVGLQSWASSIILAERMCAAPEHFSLGANDPRKLPRVLELGAGTGLVSIIAAKLLHDPRSVVFATDYHPDVLANLAANVRTNFPGPKAPVAVHALDWEFPDYSPPFDEPFDTILAADVVYHPEHARWIKGCVERLLARPMDGTDAGGVFWLIIALRSAGRHEGMDDTVHNIFPDISGMKDCKDYWALAVLNCEEFGRQGNVGRPDEGGYKLFKIGWVASSAPERL